MAVDDIEKLLTSVLKADAGVSAIVGTKIYPMVVPQDETMPALTYQKISGNWQIQMNGPHNMSQERFQINCWAATYTGAKDLADEVRDALNGYDSTVNTVEVHVITQENETDLLDNTPDVRGARRYGRALDFIVWYKVN